jgi:tRNA-dihydrouridine synthase B
MLAIMEDVVKSVRIPVTIKIRTGLTPADNVAPAIARLAEKSGIAMVTVHGRPASSGHSGAADLDAIRETVAAVGIPVVGNGGIIDPVSAARFMEYTGCAGVMIGRAAIGDPGLFGRIEAFAATGQVPPAPSWEERLALLRRHAVLSSSYYGERKGITVLRKVASFYLKGLPNAARTRDRFNRIVTLKELDALIDDIWQSPYFSEAVSGE